MLLDWVPAHFPLRRVVTGALRRHRALYEHADPKRGAHPDWGTLEFNLGRYEVRNFLIANALFWLERFHVDGLRVDAVASMLYLDYSRSAGQWVPNRYGGREDLEAVSFLEELNTVVHGRVPGTLVIAEESTAWPGVSRPVDAGGLGFGAKWNMGWMHDTLAYFAEDPINRRYHHHELTFSLAYAFSENFVLPLSHDEVVHGKGTLLTRMPGDRWQQLANLRALFGLMWAHPGKQLLFMGGELAQEREWDHERALDWALLDDPGHRGVQSLVRELNHRSNDRPALWSDDFAPSGFTWLVADDADHNVIAFLRWAGPQIRRRRPSTGAGLRGQPVADPPPRVPHRPAVRGGRWHLVLDTDQGCFGGSDAFAGRPPMVADPTPWHGQPHSAPIDLPPLGHVVWIEPAPSRGRFPVTREVWPGRPFPLGTHWPTGEGVNFLAVLRARHRRGPVPLRRPVGPMGRADAGWTSRSAPGSAGTPTYPGSLLASATATESPDRSPRPRATGSTRPSCSSTPTRRPSTARSIDATDPRATLPYVADGADDADLHPDDETDSAAAMPRCVVVVDSFDWEDDRPPFVPWSETVIYEAHVKGFTRRHPQVRADLRGHLRRPGVRRRGRAPRRPRRHRGRADAGPPHRRRELPGRTGAHQLLGLQHDRLLRSATAPYARPPATTASRWPSSREWSRRCTGPASR